MLSLFGTWGYNSTGCKAGPAAPYHQLGQKPGLDPLDGAVTRLHRRTKEKNPRASHQKVLQEARGI